MRGPSSMCLRSTGCLSSFLRAWLNEPVPTRTDTRCDVGDARCGTFSSSTTRGRAALPWRPHPVRFPDPVTYLKGVQEESVAGVEAALWSETVQNITGAEYLMMPRLPALAEVGWSASSVRDWESFRRRIASHSARCRLLGVNYYPSPQVEWQ